MTARTHGWRSRLQGLSIYPQFQRHCGYDVLPTPKAFHIVAQGKQSSTLGLHVRNHRTMKAFHIGRRRLVTDNSRCALSVAPDGRVYMVIRVDNETGFGGYYLHHLVRFDPGSSKIDDLGVLAVKNPDFYFKSPGTKHGHPATNDDHPPYYGYHKLPDDTLTPLYNHLAMIVTRDGTIYVTIIYPFTLLKIENTASASLP